MQTYVPNSGTNQAALCAASVAEAGGSVLISTANTAAATSPNPMKPRFRFSVDCQLRWWGRGRRILRGHPSLRVEVSTDCSDGWDRLGRRIAENRILSFPKDDQAIRERISVPGLHRPWSLQPSVLGEDEWRCKRSLWRQPLAERWVELAAACAANGF